MPLVIMSLVVFTALFTRVFSVDEKLCTGLKNNRQNRSDRELSASYFQSGNSKQHGIKRGEVMEANSCLPLFSIMSPEWSPGR